jgi:hypothetical protein
MVNQRNKIKRQSIEQIQQVCHILESAWSQPDVQVLQWGAAHQCQLLLLLSSLKKTIHST